MPKKSQNLAKMEKYSEKNGAPCSHFQKVILPSPQIFWVKSPKSPKI